MTTRHRILGLVVLLAGLAGCGYENPSPGTQVDVTGTLAAGGKPLGNVSVGLQPTGGTAQQVVFKVGADGTFGGKAMAGKYSWYVLVPEEGEAGDQKKAESAVKTVPAAYREASMDRQIDVAAGAKLDLQVK